MPQVVKETGAVAHRGVSRNRRSGESSSPSHWESESPSCAGVRLKRIDRSGPSGSGRAGTRIVRCSPDKPMQWITLPHEKQTAIKPRASRDREFLYECIAMRNRVSPALPRCRTSLRRTSPMFGTQVMPGRLDSSLRFI